MPRGFYKRTEKGRKNIIIANSNRIWLEESRKAISEKMKGKHNSPGNEFKKGHIPYTKLHPEICKKNSGSFKKGQIPWNKNIPRSEETKHKISLKLKEYVCTEEHRKNLSKSLKGRIFSQEWIEKNRKGQFKNPNKKFKDTNIELKVEAELKKRGINYQKQVPLYKVALADFYLPDNQAMIQCDGCYWHNCPIHHPTRHIGTRNKDTRQDVVLKNNGLKVFRYWEHEINESVEKCIDKLLI